MSAFYGLSILITNDVADEWPRGEAAATGNLWEYNGSLFPESSAAMEVFRAEDDEDDDGGDDNSVFIHSNSYTEAPVRNSNNANVSITCWPFVTILTELF